MPANYIQYFLPGKHFLNILLCICAFSVMFCPIYNAERLSDSFYLSSLLLTVLDAFHFDHETLSKEIEAAKNRETEGENVSHYTSC